MSEESEHVPAGWYPDPDEFEVERYWNGQAWTERVRAMQSVAARGDILRDSPGIKADVQIVGRAAGCDYHFTDPTVSSYHANLVGTSEGFVVIDLGSSNGTFVNSVRVRESLLADGDEVHFGLYRTTFRGGRLVIEGDMRNVSDA